MILLVDDSPEISRPLSLLLAHYGYEVCVASSGRLAMAQLADRAPHCVILDYNMPEMTGLDVLRAIRSDGRYDAVRVIMYTAQDDRRLEETLLAAGADAFVCKGSLDFAELERAVRAHCRPASEPRPSVTPARPPMRKGVG